MMFDCTPIRTYDADKKLLGAGASWTEGGLAKRRMIPNYAWTLCGGLLAAYGTYWLGSRYDIWIEGYAITAFLGMAAIGLVLIVWPLPRRQLVFMTDDRAIADFGRMTGEVEMKVRPSEIRSIEVAATGTHVTCVDIRGNQRILAVKLFPEASTKVAFQMNEALREVRRLWSDDQQSAPPSMTVSRPRRVID